MQTMIYMKMLIETKEQQKAVLNTSVIDYCTTHLIIVVIYMKRAFLINTMKLKTRLRV